LDSSRKRACSSERTRRPARPTAMRLTLTRRRRKRRNPRRRTRRGSTPTLPATMKRPPRSQRRRRSHQSDDDRFVDVINKLKILSVNPHHKI